MSRWGPCGYIFFVCLFFYYYNLLLFIFIMRSIVLKQKQRKYQAVKKREYIFLTQSAELQKDMLDMQQKVKRYKEHIYELESELQQRAELLASHEQKVTGVCH